jgi:hypothetical protein
MKEDDQLGDNNNNINNDKPLVGSGGGAAPSGKPSVRLGPGKAGGSRKRLSLKSGEALQNLKNKVGLKMSVISQFIQTGRRSPDYARYADLEMQLSIKLDDNFSEELTHGTVIFKDSRMEEQYVLGRSNQVRALKNFLPFIGFILILWGLENYLGRNGALSALVVSASSGGILILLGLACSHTVLWPLVEANAQNVVLVTAVVIGVGMLVPVQLHRVDSVSDANSYFFELGLRSILFKSIASCFIVLPSFHFLLVATLETAYFISFHWLVRPFPDVLTAVSADIFCFLLFYAASRFFDWKDRQIFLTTRNIELSKGKLEKEVEKLAFLKDGVVEAAARKSKKKKKKVQVMISYSHADEVFAFEVENNLKKTGVFDVWIDRQGIRAGEDWRGEIAEAIQDSLCVIFIVTAKSISSKYCHEELYFAKVCGVPIQPINPEGGVFQELQGGLRMILQRIQWIDFTAANIAVSKSKETFAVFDTQMKKLQASLSKVAQEQKKFIKGDHVKVVKEGSQTGREGTVVDPGWNGRVKVTMIPCGTIKSYESNEIICCEVVIPETATRKKLMNAVGRTKVMGFLRKRSSAASYSGGKAINPSGTRNSISWRRMKIQAEPESPSPTRSEQSPKTAIDSGGRVKERVRRAERRGSFTPTSAAAKAHARDFAKDELQPDSAAGAPANGPALNGPADPPADKIEPFDLQRVFVISHPRNERNCTHLKKTLASKGFKVRTASIEHLCVYTIVRVYTNSPSLHPLRPPRSPSPATTM